MALLQNITRALCLTPACVQAASEFLDNFAPNYTELDPCADFDEFVCGGWRARPDLNMDDLGYMDNFHLASQSAQDKLRGLLEGPYPGDSVHSHFSPRSLASDPLSIDKRNFDKMQRAYNACMDVTTMVNVGVEPLQAVLHDLTATDPSNPDFHQVYVAPMSKPGLGNRGRYGKIRLLAHYQLAIEHALAAVYPSDPRDGTPNNATEQAEAIVNFERRLQSIVPPLNLRNVDATSNLMSIQNTSDLIPQLELDRVVFALAPKYKRNTMVVVPSPKYLTDLSELLSNTTLETLHAYLVWHTIHTHERLVKAPEVFKPYTQLVYNKDDDEDEVDRWRICLRHTSFSARDRDLGNNIVARINAAYVYKFETLNWIEDTVKQTAKNKLWDMVLKIGYPSYSPNITDPVALHDHYAGVGIGQSFFNNSLSLARWKMDKAWSQLGSPRDRQEWSVTASTFNAFYNPSLNEIVFPACIMQPPTFHWDLPNYLNYGGFGAVAGHEIMHAFDKNGRKYDNRGRLVDWWTNASLAEYQRHADCFIDEFSNFTVKGIFGQTVHINGAMTQQENIADSAGLDAAFIAWREVHLNSKGKADLPLPGLEKFTPEQMFFVSYANMWCSKYTPGAMNGMAGSLMNSRAFREAFDCPVKEPTCKMFGGIIFVSDVPNILLCT
ncbi:hypothetical protein B0H63DRAFT_501775 [Podospora didyma]|uniref:Uncharacterized protein n=1 Tax=Podospora didyma TaxID=330526 RepID=A0AAE0TVA9_9PEZI|nr:hypothetical protein B0H63DRAFT_501775 [Podospora didyma]